MSIPNIALNHGERMRVTALLKYGILYVHKDTRKSAAALESAVFWSRSILTRAPAPAKCPTICLAKKN